MSKPFTFGLAAPTTSTPSTIGGGGGLFGSATSQQPSSLFGSPAQTLQQQQPAAQTTGFGAFSFNKPATTTASPFGQQTTTTTTTTPSLFGNLSKPSTTTATTGSAFSFGQTTSAPATTSTGFGGFGATQPAATTSAQPSAFGGFNLGGLGGATAGSSLFGNLSQTQQPQQQQQQQQPQQQSIFSLNSQQGQNASQFGTSLLGGQQSQLTGINQTQITPSTITEQERLIHALVNPQVFNDERDGIISKWNQLQAFYGFGKIFFQNASLEVNKENQFSRFKTIGYSCKPSNKNEDGLVCLIMKQKEAVIRSNKKNIVDSLHKIFNSDQSLTVNIDSIKAADDEKTEVVFYITQKVNQMTEQTNRIASLQVFNHLNKQEQPTTGLLSSLSKPTTTIKQQLEQLSVVNVYPLVGLSEEQIKSYLETSPAGVNSLLWDQAKKNNPNQKKLIPVQINGFQEINKRFKLQDKENQSHKEQLSQIAESIETINSRNKLIKSKIEQFKARNEDLEHRVLKVMINYEIRRKIGLPLQENEKYLLSVLESFQMELNSPINKEIQRQKLNEFVEIIKAYESTNRHLQMSGATNVMPSANATSVTTKSGEVIDYNNLNELQKSLREQHKAFKSLVDIISKDAKDLELIKKGVFKDK